jgi:hypothetical protein
MIIMSKTDKNTPAQENSDVFVFGKTNYKYLLIGLGLILLGFVLMLGGGSESPDVFNEAIFNTQRLTIAPILILAGFGVEFYAIMKRNK